MKNRMTRRQFTLGSTAAISALAAPSASGGIAGQSDAQKADSFEPLLVPAGEKRFGYRTIIDSTAVKLDMPVGVINGSESGPTLVVTGGLYGTEYAGVEAASRLYRDTEAQGMKGRLIVVPVVNMSSFQFRTPMFKLSAGISPMDGKDLNGVFPGRADGTITEILAWHLFQELIVGADAHIDLRGGDLAESHLVHSIHPVSGDERVNGVSEEMSRACGYEYYQPRMPRERSLVYEASVAGVPSIITQSGLGYKTQPDESFIEGHISAVTNVMKYFEMISGAPTTPVRQRLLAMDFDQVRAKVAGVFQGFVDQGDILNSGQRIGVVTDLDGSVLDELYSPIDGVVHELLVRRVVFHGDLLYNLVQIVG